MHKIGKKMSIFLLIVLCVSGTYLVYGLISGNWLLSGELSNGFLSSDVVAIQGYPRGSSQFTQGGQFNFPGNGMTWKGRVQAGSVFKDSYTDLGWAINGNTTSAVRLYNFHQNILAYTMEGYTDILPGVTYSANAAIGTQYFYQLCGALGDILTSRDYAEYLRANVVTLPAGWSEKCQQRLDADLKLSVKLDPTLLGFESFSTTDQYFNFTGAWAGVLDAKAGAAFTSGFVSTPDTIIINSANGLSTPAGDSAGLAPSTTPTPATGPTGVWADWIDAHDGTGTPAGFNVLTSPSTVTYQAGAFDLGMGKGDPITITEGYLNSNASLSGVYNPGMFADPNRGNVFAYVPISIRPQTQITTTTYTYNYVYIVQDFWGGANPASHVSLGKSVTVPSAVEVKNRWINQMINFSVVIVSNYTVHALNCETGVCVDIEPPKPNGTADVFSADITGKITGVGGGGGLLGEIMAWLPWIIVGVIAIVILYIYLNRSNKGGSGSGSVTNVYTYEHRGGKR